MSMMMSASPGDETSGENDDDNLPLSKFVEKQMKHSSKETIKQLDNNNNNKTNSLVSSEECILICSSSSPSSSDSESDLASVDEDDLPLDKFVKKKSGQTNDRSLTVNTSQSRLRTLSSEYENYDFESSKSSDVSDLAPATIQPLRVNEKVKNASDDLKKKEDEQREVKKRRGRPKKEEKPAPMKKKQAQRQCCTVEMRRELLFDDFKSRLKTATDIEITDEALRTLVTDIEREFETQLKVDKLIVQKIATFRSKIKMSTNETFFRRILRGLVKPSELPKMNSHDMSDDRIREQVREQLQHDIEMRKLYNEQIQHEKLKQLSRQKARFEMDVSSVGLSSLEELRDDEQVRPATVTVAVESSTPHPDTVNSGFDLHQATINLSSIEKTDNSASETTSLPAMDTPISPVPTVPYDVNFSPISKPTPSVEAKTPLVKKQVDPEVASDPNLIWKGYIEERSHLTYVRASHIVNVVNNQASQSMSNFDRLKRFKSAMHKTNKLTYKKKHLAQKFSFWNDYLTKRDTYAVIYFNNDHEELLHKSYLIINGQKNNSLTNHEAYSMMFERLNEHIHDNNLVYVCLTKEMEQFVDGFYLVTLRKKDNCLDKTLYEKHQIPIRRDKNKVVGVILFKPQTVAERRITDNKGYITLAQLADHHDPLPRHGQNSTTNSIQKPNNIPNIENNKRKEQFSEPSEVKRVNTEKKSNRLDPRLNRPPKIIPIDLPAPSLISAIDPSSIEPINSDGNTLLANNSVLEKADFNENYLQKFDEYLDALAKSTHLPMEKRLKYARGISKSPYLNKLTQSEKLTLIEKYSQLPEIVQVIRDTIMCADEDFTDIKSKCIADTTNTSILT